MDRTVDMDRTADVDRIVDADRAVDMDHSYHACSVAVIERSYLSNPE